MLDALGWQVVLGYSFLQEFFLWLSRVLLVIFVSFAWGYTKSFLYSMGDVLHRGTQDLPYIIWENTLA